MITANPYLIEILTPRKNAEEDNDMQREGLPINLNTFHTFKELDTLLKMKKTQFIVFIIIILMIPIPTVAQTRLYEPVSAAEERFLNNANRAIFPDDIRNDITKYANDLIAWAGIVEKHRVIEEEDYWRVDYFLKHHYYDWIEDFVGKGPIKLSPKGEGNFMAYWLFKKTADMESILKDVNGDLLIVYGIPYDIVEDGVIRLETKYIRHISKQYVDTSWLPYGREGF